MTKIWPYCLIMKNFQLSKDEQKDVMQKKNQLEKKLREALAEWEKHATELEKFRWKLMDRTLLNSTDKDEAHNKSVFLIKVISVAVALLLSIAIFVNNWNFFHDDATSHFAMQIIGYQGMD